MMSVAKPVAGSYRDTAVQKKTLQILLVEDNAGDARLLREMFGKEAAGSFELTHATRMSEAEVRLARGGIDIVLLDMGLPDGNGIEILRRALKAAPDAVMIVITGLDDELLAAEALKEGAQDYLIKGEIENRALPRALRHAVERQCMQKETDQIRAHQLQLKDEFLSHVSHELRSPLTSIYSFTTIIADGLAGETTPQQQDYLGIISKNVRQLRSMIEDLLEVTQAQTGKLTVKLQPVSVNEAIDYALDTFHGVALEKRITLSSNPCALLSKAYADPTRVQQILTILVDNAVKFTPAGGAVNIQASVHDKDAGFLLVEVSDTGCGIPAGATDHIFEHHYQVATVIEADRAGRKGLGLGLHIAKELVTRLGGTIWVSSEPQKGSRFFFTLPILSSEAPTAQCLPVPSSPSSGASSFKEFLRLGV
jgi:signal transduction histidine kinase